MRGCVLRLPNTANLGKQAVPNGATTIAWGQKRDGPRGDYIDRLAGGRLTNPVSE
jgi:hypothetical protein